MTLPQVRQHMLETFLPIHCKICTFISLHQLFFLFLLCVPFNFFASYQPIVKLWTNHTEFLSTVPIETQLITYLASQVKGQGEENM